MLKSDAFSRFLGGF